MTQYLNINEVPEVILKAVQDLEYCFQVDICDIYNGKPEVCLWGDECEVNIYEDSATAIFKVYSEEDDENISYEVASSCISDMDENGNIFYTYDSIANGLKELFNVFEDIYKHDPVEYVPENYSPMW